MSEIIKLCIVTASRSEYGILRWLMSEIMGEARFSLQIVVTGSHLSPEFGNTYKEIEKDGFTINEKVEMLLSSSSKKSVAKSMGLCIIGLADAFDRLKPDLLIVLGDRYELLAVCSTAVVMNIPIAHISGGDITEGAIDDQIRNAVTKLSVLHFPGTKESADRILRMGVKPENVYIVGEPGLDNFNRLSLLSRTELARKLHLDVNKKWILMTYHPETMISLEENLSATENIISCLRKIQGIQVVITKSNADYGGVEINEYLDRESKKDESKFKFFDSLGQLNYLSLMKQSCCLVGNSSSGIIEAPFLKIPVINIGNRQKGRYLCDNVFSISSEPGRISSTIEKVCSNSFINEFSSSDYYGDGKTSVKIFKILKERLLFSKDLI